MKLDKIFTKLTLICSVFLFSHVSNAEEVSHLDQPMYSDGKVTTLGALADGRPSLLIFWAVDCQFCKKEVPAINELTQRYSDNILILAVNQDQDFDALMRIPEYVKKHNLLPKVVQDPNGTIGAHFKVPGTPTAILLNTKGEVLRKTHTKLKNLTAAIDLLIKG